MNFWILPFVVSCALAAPNVAPVYSGVGVYGPSYHVPIAQAAVPVAASGVTHSTDGLTYTATNVHSPTGQIKQHTAVGKDGLGGHTIKHSAQATNVDPHTGQTDVKHDEHEFHINPFIGQAAVVTNKAEGSLNPAIGQAAFAQNNHEAKIAPGHASVADVKETAAVSAYSSAASRDVNAARTDVLPDGIAKNAHASHKSYVNTPGLGGQSKAAEMNHRSFDGPGYGNMHYDNQAADEAYDALGHASANEQGYKLDQAYDARVNLGSSNELQYSRHASHDPYGNYGAVTQTRQATQGGQLVPVAHEQPALVKEVVPVAPVAYSEPHPVGYSSDYHKPAAYVYNEPAPVAYQKQPTYYSEPVPVSYQKHSALVYEPRVTYKPVAYKSRQAYGPSHYSNEGYYGYY